MFSSSHGCRKHSPHSRQLLHRTISGSLGRLGVDPTQAVLTLNLDPAPPQPWQGEFAYNDGNGGTGQFRSINSFSKTT